MYQKLIIDKITDILDSTDSSYYSSLTKIIGSASRTFVGGAGRSGLIAKFFAMRLMHGGFNVFLVGDVLTPSIKNGDLLVIISGSGETGTMVSLASRAKEAGAFVVLLSSKATSTLGELADFLCQIKIHHGKTAGMPMGTTFELSTLIFLEIIVAQLMHETGITEEEMKARHANLE